MFFTLLFGLVMICLPIALIFRGVRGVRIDDHPLCRKCGFDLFGRPAGTAVCGECGIDLSKRKAIVIGHKVKRRKSLALGVSLLICSTTFLGIDGYGRARQVNWWTHAPLWYVLREAASTDATRRSPAIAELSDRCVAKSSSETIRHRILDAGLAYQLDGTNTWDPAWGTLIENAYYFGLVSDDRWKRYLSQSVKFSLTLKVMPEVKLGEPLKYSVDIAGGRVSPSFGLTGKLTEVNLHLAEGAAPMNSSWSYGFLVANGRAFDSLVHNWNPDGRLSPGNHTIHLTGTVSVGVIDAGSNGTFIPISTDAVDLPCTFKVLPADPAVAQVVREP